MLELSPATMQCTHGAAIKLFAGKGHWRPSYPVVGSKVGEWREVSKLRRQRLWARRQPVTS